MSAIYTLGIDVGSTASKCIMLKDGEEIVAKSLIDVGAGTSGPQRAIDAVLENAGMKKEDVAFTLATGYGRNSLMNFADKQMSELSCHARGAYFLFPDVHTVIDLSLIHICAAIEKGELTYEDYSQDVLMLQLHAASLGLPYLPVRMMQGSGLVKFWGISEEKRKTMEGVDNLKCVDIENPFEPGEKLLAVPVPKLDCAIIHVQQASPDGTCIIDGDEFHDVDIAIAAKRTIVTCEEIVSDEYIRRDPTKTRIFGECVDAVVRAPYGAWPAQCYGYYDDDDKGLKEYDKASK